MPVGRYHDGRSAVLEFVARRAVTAADGRRALVAIDGVDGAGKSVFADALATWMRAQGRPVIRASADDFHHRRGVRYRRGRDSPEGFWRDSFDYETLRKELLEPLRPEGSGRYRCAAHDLMTDERLDLPWESAPHDAVLVLDGLFLHRDELVDLWDFSVLLEVPFTVSVPRMAIRDDTSPHPEHPSLVRYVQGQRLYFAACSPRDRADVVIDNADWNHPTVVSAR